MTHVVVLAGLVKVLCIVAANYVYSVLFLLVDSGEIGPGVIKICPMFEHALFFYILEHPIATLIILVATTDAEKPAVITHDSPAELWYIRFKVNQILRLLRSNHVVEVNVFVAPFEVMDYTLISQLLFHYK